MTASPDVTTAAAARQRGDRVTVELGPMVHGGVCMARLEDGVTLFADNGIPGETAVVELTYRRKKVWFGRVVEQVGASPHRVTPPCRFVGACGGCQLQHIAYSHQLDLKREIVADAMRRHGITLPEATRVHGMDDPWHYRWRGEFHVIPGGDGMNAAELGFNRVRSWTAIPIDDCLIHHTTISGALGDLREVVRRGGDTSMTSLHVTAGEAGEELLVRSKPASALRGDVVDAVALRHRHRWAREATTLRWRGMAFRVAPESFIQVNWTQMETLYGLVLEHLSDVNGQRIVDGYAGIGVMSCAIAAEAEEVVCIENNPASCRMGRLNAQMNGVDERIRYVVQPVEEALSEMAAASGVDQVILDPPRSGCESAVTGYLALAGPARIIYVSCDPATLARDLRVLCGSGPYRLDAFEIVDMFPQTYHVESVAVLSRT